MTIPVEDDFSSLDHAPSDQCQAETEGWRPIETAPMDGTVVVLWSPEPIDRLYASPASAANVCIGFHGDSGSLYANENWWSVESRSEIWGYGGEMTGAMTETKCLRCEPTHWMPLPAPPTDPTK